MEFPVTPSVGIIIYQSPLKIHRPFWFWLGWRVQGLEVGRPGGGWTGCGKNQVARGQLDSQAAKETAEKVAFAQQIYLSG